MAMLLFSCQKPEINEIITVPATSTKGECNPVLEIHSDWTLNLGVKDVVLRHTEGLITMALSGNITRLNQEFCGLGDSDKRIPPNLGDDVYGVGYAPQLRLGDYVIAMYHPISEAPDHFITYNWKTGDWVHWNLDGGKDNMPGKFMSGGTHTKCKLLVNQLGANLNSGIGFPSWNKGYCWTDDNDVCDWNSND